MGQRISLCQDKPIMRWMCITYWFMLTMLSLNLTCRTTRSWVRDRPRTYWPDLSKMSVLWRQKGGKWMRLRLRPSWNTLWSLIGSWLKGGNPIKTIIGEKTTTKKTPKKPLWGHCGNVHVGGRLLLSLLQWPWSVCPCFQQIYWSTQMWRIHVGTNSQRF